MQKVASAGLGNPKERKECPICGKTLYDRSTFNRHMRIHTGKRPCSKLQYRFFKVEKWISYGHGFVSGEKPFPCRHCGRRFRTNYNRLGHEKKCPDRTTSEMMNAAGAAAGSVPSASAPSNGGPPRPGQSPALQPKQEPMGIPKQEPPMGHRSSPLGAPPPLSGPKMEGAPYGGNGMPPSSGHTKQEPSSYR